MCVQHAKSYSSTFSLMDSNKANYHFRYLLARPSFPIWLFYWYSCFQNHKQCKMKMFTYCSLIFVGTKGQLLWFHEKNYLLGLVFLSIVVTPSHNHMPLSSALAFGKKQNSFWILKRKINISKTSPSFTKCTCVATVIEIIRRLILSFEKTLLHTQRLLTNII